MASRPPAKKSNAQNTEPLYTIGIVSDTHIPDRVSELHPLILPSLRAAHVSHVFHAGDICSTRVLTLLNEIAPVTAVRGNRDWFVQDVLLLREMEIGGVPIALMHGHGNILRYLFDKARFFLRSYNRLRYQKVVSRLAPNARVMIFGHTHIPEIIWVQEKLFFNPGSASFGAKHQHIPSMGYLRIYENGIVKPQIQYLRGYKIINRRWVKQTGSETSQNKTEN